MYKTDEYYNEFVTNREMIIATLEGQELLLKFLWKNPDKFVTKSFNSSPFFQLFFENDILFLLLKFEDLNWIDIPLIFSKGSKSLFSFHDEKFPCKILLANSNTGKLFVNKTYFMPKGTTTAFIQYIHTQKDYAKKLIISRVNSIRASYSACEMARLSLGKI